ncbi:MAG: hypothetical protein ABIH23_13255 [bacterium]
MALVRCCFCGASVKRKTSSETLCSHCETEDDSILVEVLMFLKSSKGRVRQIYEICAEIDNVTEKRVGRWRRLGWIKTLPDGRMQIDDGHSPELDSHLRRYILNKMGQEEPEPEPEEEEPREVARMVVVERLGLGGSPKHPKGPSAPKKPDEEAEPSESSARIID